ncbi:MAG: ABC transporter ATP-binding protein [Clostridiales bacterium]|jgi:ABC-2 type transport system ATP-binding protein|nr:ABC transporter ATP-binding protein [Clostridiales bacterium]
MAIISVEHLTKDYGFGRGVFDVSFGIQKGEVFGFLGPNGAGKTTTIRHIMGFSKPMSGATSVLGLDSCTQYSQFLKSVGYLPGEIALPAGLTGWEFIKMMGELRKSNNKERLDYLLAKFELDPSGSVKRMSLGVKRKLAVVTAFMDDPEVLILDEPTSGLDPVMQENFIGFIKEEKKRGKTILLSSHIFREVDATCDRIAIIKDGRIQSTVVANDLRHNNNKTYQIEFCSDADYAAFANKGFELSFKDQAKRKVKVNIKDSDINYLIAATGDIKINYFKEIKFTLEDYFMSFYKASKEFGGIK